MYVCMSVEVTDLFTVKNYRVSCGVTINLLHVISGGLFGKTSCLNSQPKQISFPTCGMFGRLVEDCEIHLIGPSASLIASASHHAHPHLHRCCWRKHAPEATPQHLFAGASLTASQCGGGITRTSSTLSCDVSQPLGFLKSLRGIHQPGVGITACDYIFFCSCQRATTYLCAK